MNWQQFEHKIRQQLSRNEPSVNVDEIWAAIEPQVDQLNDRRKKRRAFIIWCWAMAAALGGTAAFYVASQPAGKKAAEMQVNAAVATKTEAGLKRSALAAPDEAGTDFTAEKAGSVAAANAVENAAANAVEKSFKNDWKAGNAATGKTIPKQQLPVQTDAVSPEIPVEATKGTPLATGLVVEKTQENKLENAVEKNTEIGPVSILALNFFDKKPALGPLPEILANAAALPGERRLRRSQFQFSASVQGSASFLERKLEAKDSLYTALHTLREKHERELEAVQLGIRLQLHHESGFGLSTGLNFTQLNEQFRYFQSVITVDTVEGIKYLVVNLDNDTIPIYGDVPLERKTSFRKEYFNKYRLFEVPVLANYRYEGRQFSIGAQAGVFVNLRLSTQGRVLEAEGLDTDISSGIFRSNVGLSYYLGFSAGYLLNDNLEVYLSPFVRHFPKSFTADSYGLRQRYNLYGVNAGVGWRF